MIFNQTNQNAGNVINRGENLTRDEWRTRILDALKRLGVECAGRFTDKLRWSVSDLATDLAEQLTPPNDRADD